MTNFATFDRTNYDELERPVDTALDMPFEDATATPSTPTRTVTVTDAYEQKAWHDQTVELEFRLSEARGGAFTHVVVGIRPGETEQEYVVHCEICLKEFVLQGTDLLTIRPLVSN